MACLIQLAFSQNPLIKKWDYRFGGTSTDALTCFQQTNDGGYILGGFSISGISGDKTQSSWGNRDYWIIKIDSMGSKQWDKDFGGTGADELYSIQQTNDGGYILGGHSNSGLSGNKTHAGWGSFDYWIIKTDSLGNILWDKDFGGASFDYLYSIQQTSDRGYILGGYSWSGISGNKTQPAWGIYDYWIVKIDSLGNMQWDKDFGGTDNDQLYSIKQTADGGFILGGYSFSGVGGNKTQPTWNNSFDYWILKTDSLGNIQWDKDYGGISEDDLYSIQQTIDGGFILAGLSASGISGDKTQVNSGGFDFWIIKTDSLGNMQWDKDFGGIANEDEFGNITQTSDNGFLLAGTSYSSIGGDKTENNLGAEQSWILKLDPLGNIVWDKTLFTASHDEIGLALQTGEACYTIANYTTGGIGGYKTQLSWDTICFCYPDYWLIKFCDSTFLPPVALATNNTTNLCPGVCTDFINLSTNAVTYQWNFPGAIPGTDTSINPTNICYQTPGIYDVELIASNAYGIDTLFLASYITVYPYSPPQSILQDGDTLFANAGSMSYQWYFNGAVIPGATNYFYIAPSSGDYNVVATDQNNCEVEAVINDVIAEIQLPVGNGQLAIFPNPVTDKLFLIGYPLLGTVAEIFVYNLMGEKISLDIDRDLLTVNCKPLKPGIYFLEVVSEKKYFRSKFVKQ
jgi:hypothetical protein